MILKRLFCNHVWQITWWQLCHGPFGNDPLCYVYESVCVKCGKKKTEYAHLESSVGKWLALLPEKEWGEWYRRGHNVT